MAAAWIISVKKYQRSELRQSVSQSVSQYEAFTILKNPHPHPHPHPHPDYLNVSIKNFWYLSTFTFYNYLHF
jgi:hypothetical protein